MQLVYTIVEGDRDDFVETRSFAWEEQLNYFVGARQFRLAQARSLIIVHSSICSAGVDG